MGTTTIRRYIKQGTTQGAWLLLLCGLLLAFAHPAYAIDGTITVSGAISATTCTVANGTQTVTLPSVSTSALATANATAGITPFTLTLSACGSLVSAKPYFEYGSTVNANGRLTKTSGTSNNIEIQLLDPNFTPINLLTQAGVSTFPITAGSGTIKLYARYYATGTPTAGTISTSVTFSLVYL